jgi:DNA-binding NarL/FixJ family response regulator
MEGIRVTLVDKRTFFKSGLRRSMKVIDCEPAQLMTIIERQSPDVVLLDVEYPSVSGLELCKRIVRRFARTSVVLLTSDESHEELVDVLRSGAAGYLRKNATVEEFSNLIKQVCLGKYPIIDMSRIYSDTTPEIPKQSQGAVLAGQVRVSAGTHLTPHEVRITQCIANGMTNKEIGRVLHISEQTVKNHISSILRKLDARDRAHAAVLATRGGLITEPAQPSELPWPRVPVSSPG